MTDNDRLIDPFSLPDSVKEKAPVSDEHSKSWVADTFEAVTNFGVLDVHQERELWSLRLFLCNLEKYSEKHANVSEIRKVIDVVEKDIEVLEKLPSTKK